MKATMEPVEKQLADDLPLYNVLANNPAFAWIDLHYQPEGADSKTGLVRPVHTYVWWFSNYKNLKKLGGSLHRLMWLLGAFLLVLGIVCFAAVSYFIHNVMAAVEEPWTFVISYGGFLLSVGFACAGVQLFAEAAYFPSKWKEMLEDHAKMRWVTADFAEEFRKFAQTALAQRHMTREELITSLPRLGTDLKTQAEGNLPSHFGQSCSTSIETDATTIQGWTLPGSGIARSVIDTEKEKLRTEYCRVHRFGVCLPDLTSFYSRADRLVKKAARSRQAQPA